MPLTLKIKSQVALHHHNQETRTLKIQLLVFTQQKNEKLEENDEKMVGPIYIGKIIKGRLFILLALSNLVRAASFKEDGIDHLRGKENEERIYIRFSKTSGIDLFDKYGIQQRLETEYSDFDMNSSNEPATNSTNRVNQTTSIQTTQFSPSKIVVNMKRTSEAHLKTLGSEQGSGRSFTVLHMFLKTLKKTLKALRPEIKLSECAQKYFFSTYESETSTKPTHNHEHTHDKKKKKKKKHKHDPDKDYSDHITDGVVSSVFGLHSDFANIIYEEYRPYLQIARSVYKNVKSTFEIIRQDALMKCTVDYLAARFCIWVDG